MTSDPLQLTVLLDGPAQERARLAGPLIADRFELGAVLGVGGMGTVVAAFDREAERAVAVKTVPATATAQHAGALLDEARIQGRLDHPSIPPVFELGRDAHGHPAFAMRQVSGDTLASILAGRRSQRAQRPLATAPIGRLLRVFIDVCRAMEHAHARGVVHGDLKPSNIMIGADGRVHVIDWGVATLVGDASAGARRAGGTLGYMAPEQINPRAVLDGRADVYALGCILFEMLAGEPLVVRDESMLEVVLTGVDARPSQRAGGGAVPPALEAVCVRATRTAAADRYPDVTALAAAVTDWIDVARDRALREDLAARALAAATAALADPAHPDQARALREAGRALALTPEAAAPAELIRSLINTDDVPAPAAPAIDELTRGTEQRLARAAALSYCGFLVLPALLLAQGGADLGFVALVVAGWLGLEVVAIPVARGGGARGWLWWSVGLLVIECTLFARYLGPFVTAPAVAALAVAGAMMHPRIHHRGAITALLCLPPLVPFALEQLGVTAPTIGFVGDELRLTSAVSGLQPLPTFVGLVATALALLAVSLVIGRVVASGAHDARRRLTVQTWHLEQLVLSTERVEAPPP